MKFHLPTQTHRGDSFGVLFGWLDSWMCHAHSSAPLHMASQFAKGHLNGSAKLKRPSCSLGAGHLHLGSQWTVSSPIDCFHDRQRAAMSRQRVVF